MASGGYIVNAALLQLGIIRVGQTAATTELNDGLQMLNRLVDSWSTERLLLPVVGAQYYSLSTAKSVYSVGPSAPDFPGPRPLRIDSANFLQLLYNGAGTSFSSPLRLIGESEFQAIVDKTASSDVSELLYYSPSTPNGSFFLWPIPNVVTDCQLQANIWTPLSQFPDLVSDVALYPGLEMALVFNLAVMLEPDMVAAKLSQATIAEAAEAKTRIAKLNALMLPQMPDAAIPPGAAAPFEPVPATLRAVAQAKSVVQQ